ncbi:hypothetical protein Tco_1327839 [Tanacetum coccineum]
MCYPSYSLVTVEMVFPGDDLGNLYTKNSCKPIPSIMLTLNSTRNMMGEVDIDTLTIEQYLMLTQGNQAPGMVKIEFERMMEKDIEGEVFYDNECGKDCGMWPTCNPDLSFCSRYDAIYRKGEMECSNNGCAFGIMKDKVLEKINSEFTCSVESHHEAAHVLIRVQAITMSTSTHTFVKKEVFDNKIEQLANEYDLRIGEKGYAMDRGYEFAQGTLVKSSALAIIIWSIEQRSGESFVLINSYL